MKRAETTDGVKLGDYFEIKMTLFILGCFFSPGGKPVTTTNDYVSSARRKVPLGRLMTRRGGAKPLIRALPDSAGCLGSAKCNFLVSHDAAVLTGSSGKCYVCAFLQGEPKYKSGLNCQFEPCRAVPCRVASSPQSLFLTG